MAKDYAKYANNSRHSKKKSRELDTLIILLIVLIIGGVGYWFYADKIRPNFAENKSLGGLFAAVKSAFHKAPDKAPAKLASIVKVPKQEAEVHFDFYNQLPNMQVRVTTAEATTTGASVALPTGYVLQLALYNSLNEASEARISYLLSGADASVVKVGASYRVQQGPYTTLATAKAVQKKLLKKGIETTLKKTTA